MIIYLRPTVIAGVFVCTGLKLFWRLSTTTVALAVILVTRVLNAVSWAVEIVLWSLLIIHLVFSKQPGSVIDP